MVAALAASPAPDVCSASELGSLLLGYRSISDPRWRLRAVVALVPVCQKFGIALDTLRAELRRGVRASTCPALWRARLEKLLVDKLDQGCVRGLALIVDALFTRDSRRSASTAISAMLALGDDFEALLLATAASWGRHAGDGATRLLDTGCTADGEFVGNVDQRGSELRFRPSLPLLRACIDAVVEHRQRERIGDIEKLARSLPTRERGKAEAQLARLTLAFESPQSALARVRAIREKSIRAGALLLLTRASKDVDTMRVFASAMETQLMHQLATLEIARALYRHGLHGNALRELQRVDDPRLEAERLVLRAELRLTVRRSSESGIFVSERALCDAYAAPAWTAIEPRVDVETSRQLETVALLVRFAMRNQRDEIVLAHAGEIVPRYAFCVHARRAWLDLAQRSGVDIERALLALQTDSNAAALDALRAEQVAMRAQIVANAPQSPAMVLGLAALASANNDARSLERAQFDEGLALSSAAASRRRVLITTAQTCLRAALVKRDDWSMDVIAARLRTLVHLGGGLAIDAIRKALVTLPAHPIYTRLAIEALCQLDAVAAARFVLERANELQAAGVDIERVLQTLEVYDALPRGLSRAYCSARTVLTRNCHDAQPWLAGLLALMRTRLDSLLRVLTALESYSVIPTSPSALVAELDDVPQQLVAQEHATLAAELFDNASVFEAFLVARPARVDPRMTPWDRIQWRALLRKATSYLTVHRQQVHRFARRVGRPHWFEALCSGDLEQLGVTTAMPFEVDRTRYQLLLLDKRLDILTYLRFADTPIRSCFHSDSEFYDDALWRTRDSTIETWKDPLAFCFRIERQGGGSFQPCGFLFGNFATVDDQPAVVMNSLHVRPSGADVRKQVMLAFERALCDPLAIKHVGIANAHQGRGELPAAYVRRRVRFMRYRALANAGWPLARTYDDISHIVNEPITVESLWWRS
jgi:hypothetical protein